MKPMLVENEVHNALVSKPGQSQTHTRAHTHTHT